jgi:hypothetical protein
MEPAGVDRSVVFNQCVRDGLILGVITGAASGTAAAPVLGTIIGALVGLVLAVPVSLLVAAAVAPSARAAGNGPSFRRRIDVTFVVFAALVALLAVGWISLDPLVGAAPAITMLVVVVLGLLFERRRLRRLAPAPNG